MAGWATVVLVGDRAQLPAVGRDGVLDMAAKTRGRTYDMTKLHRFRDAEYAALTLRMRDRANHGEVFDRLTALCLVTLHADDDAAPEHITEHTRDREAITVATNDEATALNERIRAGRVDRGEVNDTVTATGSDGLPIGAGDLIQTRKNDSELGVANRQQWIVQHVTDDGTLYACEVGSGRKNPRTVTLPAEYVAEHAHLSYAATAYGVQGATVDSSHTVLTEATSAAGFYVGMTRGRETNRLHVVAPEMAAAKARFIEAMERDPADRGLVSDGPVRLVTDELARLDQEADRAQRQAERWSRSPSASTPSVPRTGPRTTRAPPCSARQRARPSGFASRSRDRLPPRPRAPARPISRPCRSRRRQGPARYHRTVGQAQSAGRAPRRDRASWRGSGERARNMG